jgi:stage V sporulation protein B
MEEKSKKTFVGGAALLGVAGLLSKILGACFRIPLANIIGDDGMGYYQTAYPIYIALLTISTTGIPTAISRMVAERRAQGKYRESFRIYRHSLFLMACIGVVTGLALFLFAPQICRHISEPNAIWCMYSLAPALVVCPIISSIRGYFQGQRNMVPTAVSQVVEQIFRVTTGFVLAMMFLGRGLEYSAAGATSGASIGGALALLYTAIAFWRKKHSLVAEFEPETDEPKLASGAIFKELLSIAVPITLGALIMPIINTMDTVVVKTRLLSIGYDQVTARSLFGQLSGMASPIINMPDAVTAAVCMSLVPVIADAKLRGDSEFVKQNTQLSVRYASLVGMPCAVGILALARPIMLLLYPLQKDAAINAATCLAAYSPGIALLAIHQAFSGVLQGIGKQHIPVRNLFIGAVIKLVATYVLCGIPEINVTGAAYGTVITYAISACLNYLSTKKYTGVKLDLGLCVFKPLICSALMGVCAWGTYRLLYQSVGNTVSVLLAIAVAVVVYVALVFVTGTITSEELKGVKKLEKLTVLLDKVMPKRKI